MQNQKEPTPVGTAISITEMIRQRRVMRGALARGVGAAICSQATFNTNGISGSPLRTNKVTTVRARIFARERCRCFAESQALPHTIFDQNSRRFFLFSRGL